MSTAAVVSRVPSLSFSIHSADESSAPVTPNDSLVLPSPPPTRKPRHPPPPPSAFVAPRGPRLTPSTPSHTAPTPATTPSPTSPTSTSTAASTTSPLLSTILHIPAVLRRILADLPWPAFHALSLSCQAIHSLLDDHDPRLRHIVFARFVPGYAAALAQSDPAAFRDVPLGFEDLALFMESQTLQLHHYPTLALSLLSPPSPSPSADSHARAHHLAALCAAHSRVVLLLQSLVHSSSLPLPLPVSDDATSTTSIATTDTRRYSRLRHRPAAAPQVRDLVFPAPLIYFSGEDCEHDPEIELTRSNSKRHSLLKRKSTRLFARSASPGPESVSRRSSLSKRKDFSSSSRTHGRAPSAPARSAPSLVDPYVRPTGSPPPPPSLLPHSPASVERRASVFGARARVPLPPPTADTIGLRTYAGGWRRRRERESVSVSASASMSTTALASAYGSVSTRGSVYGSVSPRGSMYGSISPRTSFAYGTTSASMSDSEDGLLFRRPRRQFVQAASTPTSGGSSRSSISSSPATRDASLPPPPPPSAFPSSLVSSPVSTQTQMQFQAQMHTQMQSQTHTPSSGPHDIRHATSRTRAPVLRVFHPCASATGALDDAALEACEDQLDDAGLWTHLSTGDVVCNLGWLASSTASVSGAVGEDSGGSGGSGSGSGSSSGSSADASEESGVGSGVGWGSGVGGGAGAALWLLFDGARLVPFSPGALLPLADPLALPSPLYYQHVLPPPASASRLSAAVGAGMRMRFVMPPVERDGEELEAAGFGLALSSTGLLSSPGLSSPGPTLTLTALPATVRSPHSPRGIARTVRYAWVARVTVRRADEFGTSTGGVGAGWQTEWILEGEGTKEGREVLLRILASAGAGGGKAHEWEMVPERTTGAVLWLRLVA